MALSPSTLSFPIPTGTKERLTITVRARTVFAAESVGAVVKVGKKGVQAVLEERLLWRVRRRRGRAVRRERRRRGLAVDGLHDGRRGKGQGGGWCCCCSCSCAGSSRHSGGRSGGGGGTLGGWRRYGDCCDGGREMNGGRFKYRGQETGSE